MLKISTAYQFQSSVNTMQQRQAELSLAQQQLTSGKRIAKPSDDPTGIAVAERALAEQARGEQMQRSIDASKNAMSMTESAMGQSIDLMQSVRETLVAAGNGSYSTADRASLATQLTALRAQLLSVANQSDGAGGYLFSGQASTQQPFVDSASGVTMQLGVVSGEVSASNTERLPLSVDGPSMWLQANTGNGSFETSPTQLASKANGLVNSGTGWIAAGTVSQPQNLTGESYEVRLSSSGGATTYSVFSYQQDAAGGRTSSPVLDANGAAIQGIPFVPGKTITDIPGMSISINGTPADGDSFDVKPSLPTLSIFNAIDKAVAALQGKSTDGAGYMQAVNTGMRDVDQVLSRFQASRALVGETLNQLDDLTSRTADRVLAAKTTRSNAEDLDMVAAVSEFQTKQTAYQAALQSYTMMQKQSLFNYMN